MRLADNERSGMLRLLPRDDDAAGSAPDTSGPMPQEALRLSVVMAAHNEERTIETAISRILAVRCAFEIELLVVDDGSSDRSFEIASSFDDPRVTVLRHEQCAGKGAAILTGAAAATGTHLLVFDADLEYSARDIPALVQPVLDGEASVVYGARIPGLETTFPSWTYALGSRATTLFANVVYGSWLRDMHTCLKLVPLALFRELELSESGFGLDTEMTGEILRRGIRPFEVACSYRGRTVAEGKKISARDGIECLKILVGVRLRGRFEYHVEMMEPLRLPNDDILPDHGAMYDVSEALGGAAAGVSGFSSALTASGGGLTAH